MTKNEYKAQAKASLTKDREGIAGILASIGVLEVGIGIFLANIRETFRAAKAEGVSLAKTAGIGTDDWREYARECVPGKSAGTLYRWAQAGTVAKVLGDDLHKAAVVGSLVPLYRILNEAEADSLEAAEDLVRETYKDLVAKADGEAPSEPDVLAAAQRVSPTTKGKASGKGKAEAGGSTSPATEDEGTEEEAEGSDSRRESGDSVLVLDPIAVESARADWAGQAKALTETHGLTAEQIAAVGLAVLRFASERTIPMMQAVLAAVPTTEAEGKS